MPAVCVAGLCDKEEEEEEPIGTGAEADLYRWNHDSSGEAVSGRSFPSDASGGGGVGVVGDTWGVLVLGTVGPVASEAVVAGVAPRRALPGTTVETADTARPRPTLEMLVPRLSTDAG